MSGCRLSVSIVTHNHADSIRETLDSILRHTKDVDFQLFVVDNGSEDRTCEIVREYGFPVTLIQNPKNPGFGASHNQVILRAGSTYHAIINPDVTLCDNVLQRMAAYLDEHPDIGMLTPKVLFPDGRLQVLPKRDPRFIFLISRRLHWHWLQKYRRTYEMGDRDPDTRFDIEFTTGCFMFARTALLQQVGGFDERFFLYFEDADLGRRVRALARTEYNPSFVIRHAWRRGGARSLRMLLIQVWSMYRYMRKWRRVRSS